jgi:large subunit ribosomal protein L5
MVTRVEPRLKAYYREEVVPALMREFGYRNIMEVPGLEKISINIGLGEAVANPKALEAASADLAAITGQRPVVTRARKSIANFKVRKGMPIGLMVTLRGDRMWEFLDRLLNAVLPRIRDFQGVPTDSFDGRGNYSLGIREQVIFPEIEYDKIDRVRGLQVNIITTARTDEEAKRLLELLGMPFARR